MREYFFIVSSSDLIANFDLISLVRRESNSGAYFAGMFRVANVEFIPEYRQAESHEFVSMASKIQHVVCVDVTLLFTRWLVLNMRSEKSLTVNCWCLVGEQHVQDVLSGQTLQASCHFRPQVQRAC